MKLRFLPIFALIALNSSAQLVSDTILIKKHLLMITKSPIPRNHLNLDQLDSVAAYIFNEFLNYADTVYYQEFSVNNKTYKNVICSFGIKNPSRIITGAHYDVCGNQDGADDNASGVVGLLELARMLKGEKLKNRIDLVAYSLEEPPYFRTQNMGSYIHAKSLKDEKIHVKGMISLEMIGYFKDEKKTQSYPVGIMKVIYGTKGNYITIVKRSLGGKFARKFHRRFKKSDCIKTKKLSAPSFIPGLDLSDHLNYWNFGYSAVMITDTAFFRNPNYHRKTDRIHTLDIQRMSKVIDGVFQSLIQM